MKVSLNYIRFINDKYACSADPAPDGIERLVEKVGAQLGAVEEVIDLGKRYEGVVVAKVVACEKHPNADKLSVCTIDDGGVVKNVERSKESLIQVVCGAPNVAAGQLVAWIPPGAVVPSTFEKEPFVLETREIRGSASSGMIASSKELALGDNHEGILAIDEDVKPGTPFAKVYGLDDYIIDIENKMFTHRPDLFGHLGIARELAGIQGHVFKSPDWYRPDAKVKEGNSRSTHPLIIKNEVPELVPRFTAAVMKDVTVKESPNWLKARLSRLGVRPINNIVDITNLMMLTTAQPLHAYDYDKVKVQGKDAKEANLVVRISKEGEKLKLLGGQEIILKEGAVIIATDSKAIGLGGVMGGADTEVDESTTSIIFECANFDMNTTRKTAMTYGLFTDAATRFTKGQSPLQNATVLAKTVDDTMRIVGGRVVGSMYDDNHVPASIIKRGSVHPAVNVSAQFINSRLGLDLGSQEIAKLLKNVEFGVEVKNNEFIIKAPFWRTDIEIPEDIVEEVGRLHGYDHLPLQLPRRDIGPTPPDRELSFKSYLRYLLVSAGGNEVLTYSFVNDFLLKAADQNPKEAYRIRNALSPDLKYYRLSLSPSLLEKVHPNIKLGFDEFALFELGRTHVKDVKDEQNLPMEIERLSLVYASKNKSASPYYSGRKMTDYLGDKLSFSQVAYTPFEGHSKLPKEWSMAAAAFEPRRTAVVSHKDTLLGLVGEPSQKIRQALKLPSNTSMLELDTSALEKSSGAKAYKPLNRFPETSQDICFKVQFDVTYAKLENYISSEIKKLAGQKGYNWEMKPLDIFQKLNDKSHKQITWRIKLSHPDRTLTTEEVNRLLEEIAQKAKAELGAERI